jgi:hypothetical protein
VQSRLETFRTFVIAFLLLALGLVIWQQWSDRVAASSKSKPIGAWLMEAYERSSAPDIIVFGDSQIGGLRSADARVAKRKLDFALDHRSYALESELRNFNTTHSINREEISNALSRLGYANSLSTSSSDRSLNGIASAKVFVASQPGCLASDYFVMANALFSEDKKPLMAIITINPRTFLDNGLACPGDSQYFRYFVKHTNLDSEIFEHAYPSFGNKFTATIKNITRSKINQVDIGQFVFLPDDAQVFNERAILYPPNFSFQARSCSHQIWFLEKTLAFLKDRNIKTVVISMPLLKSESIKGLRSLHDSLKTQISDLCEKNAAGYLDLTNDNRFLTNDFLDPVHLSQAGGAKFAHLLPQYITETGFHGTIPSQSNGIPSLR